MVTAEVRVYIEDPKDLTPTPELARPCPVKGCEADPGCWCAAGVPLRTNPMQVSPAREVFVHVARLEKTEKKVDSP